MTHKEIADSCLPSLPMLFCSGVFGDCSKKINEIPRRKRISKSRLNSIDYPIEDRQYGQARCVPATNLNLLHHLEHISKLWVLASSCHDSLSKPTQTKPSDPSKKTKKEYTPGKAVQFFSRWCFQQEVHFTGTTIGTVPWHQDQL